MKLGLIQQANTADSQANITKLLVGIRVCAAKEAQLVVLPPRPPHRCLRRHYQTID